MVLFKNDLIFYRYNFNKYKMIINSELKFEILVFILYGLSLLSEVGVSIISMPSNLDSIPQLYKI